VSYTIELKSAACDKCGRHGTEPDLPDPTYNLTEIFDLALTGEPLPNASVSEFEVVLLNKPTDRPRGLRLLSGRKAKETEPQIQLACERLAARNVQDVFKQLEPPNGWGTLEDAKIVMHKLLEASREYPENTWNIT
jgi:hypothetical protein